MNLPHPPQPSSQVQPTDSAQVERSVHFANAAAALSQVPPIYTLNHLAVLTGASYGYLRGIVARKFDPYWNIEQRKKSGGYRHISAPQPMLLDTQRWILDQVLPALRQHPKSYAYRGNRSTRDAAQVHIGAAWLIKIDLHDFFPTITEPTIFKLFRALGYGSLLSFELTRICTRPDARRSAGFRSRRGSICDYDVSLESGLPQGSPTSGALANAAFYDLDVALENVAIEFGGRYTRYSDDLIFSWTNDLGRAAGSKFISRVQAVLGGGGYELHRKKTRLIPPGARKVVLGLLIHQDKVRLLPEFRRRIEMHIRGVDRFGLAPHASHRKFDSTISFVSHVDGCLAYASFIEADWTQKMNVAWRDALRKSGVLR